MRRLSIALVTFLIFAVILSPARAADSSAPVVKTRLGKVVGKAAGGGVRAFLGIPYAAPPVGALRWKAPMPAAKWKGVRQAMEFGPHCMQPTLYADMIFRDPGISEDCLTLNVWSPAKDKRAKLPVMVWIYGGGFVAGGTSEPRQDGANLAKHGVVVVSMNYRLGIFGFFAHPALAAESEHHSAGNYGLLDQTAALRWVKENIAAFGGDAGNVTIFGESAGSYSVSSQMASPLAAGLFEKAIGESGSALYSRSLKYMPLSAKEAEGEQFAAEILKVTNLDQMRAIPAKELMEASRKVPAGGPDREFAPTVDGYFFPESVAAIFAAGKQNDVPLLAGWNRDEDGIAEKATVESLKAEADKAFGERAAEFLKLYPAETDEEAVRAASDFHGDRSIAYATWKWLEAQVATGKRPVYRYRFDQVPPADPNHKAGNAAYHSGEIQYVFGNLDLLQGYAWTADDRRTSELMQSYWTNFAKAGDPNGEGLPKWPAYSAADGWRVMVLTYDAQPRLDRFRERYLFLDSVWGK